MGTQGSVTVAVYRLNLGVGAREFVREVYRLAAEVGPAGASILSLPVKPLRDLLAGRKSYGSYRRVSKTLISKVSAIVGSERAYVAPVAMRYGGNTYLSVIEGNSGAEVARKFVRFGGEFKGHVPRSPILSIRGVNTCFLILDDLFYPEVARYCAESGSTALVGIVPPVVELDPDLVILAARMRAYENMASVIVVGGYLKDGSTPTVVVRRDGSIADLANDARSEIIEIELAGEAPARRRNEVVRRHYARAIKILNSFGGDTIT